MHKNDEVYFIYITFPAKDKALEIAENLVKLKLIACANIYENVISIFEWEGKIEKKTECTMICKAPGSAVDKIIEFITDQHPYNCPCVVAIKIEKGNEDFLKWVRNI